MDLDQLHTFLEIVRLKSFSKAAQSCFRTQPAVSAQVRQLEQELNAPLFERLGTKIAITPAGHIFAEYAEQILDLRRRAQDSINELERVPRGELLIAANEATCIYVLPLVFSEFKKQFPNVQILVDRSYGARVVEAVLDNQADRSEEHTSELQSHVNLVCRLLLEKKTLRARATPIDAATAYSYALDTCDSPTVYHLHSHCVRSSGGGGCHRQPGTGHSPCKSACSWPCAESGPCHLSLWLLGKRPDGLFFFEHGAHRDLHSFPTRRSSD